MRLFEIYHLDQYERLFRKDIWKFDIAIWLHTFGRSAISVFIPIFLIQMGWTIPEVILFYLVYNIFDSPLNFVARHFILKYGARASILCATVIYILFFVCLSYLAVGNWYLLMFMALLFALYDTFFWVAMVYFFMKCEKNDENISKSLSLFNISRRFAAMVAPLIGAGVLLLFGEDVLIFVSIGIFVVSLVPLFKIHNTVDRPSNAPLPVKEFFATDNDVKAYLIQSLYSFHHVAESVIWPIFIFTVFSTIESVAAVPTIAAITTIFATYFIGSIQKRSRGTFISFGAFCISILWLLRLMIENDLFYFASVFLTGLFAVFITVPLHSYIYERGERKDALSTSMYRNWFSMTPRIFIYGVLYLLVSVFHTSFLMAAGGMFFIIFLSFALRFRDIDTS